MLDADARRTAHDAGSGLRRNDGRWQFCRFVVTEFGERRTRIDTDTYTDAQRTTLGSGSRRNDGANSGDARSYAMNPDRPFPTCPPSRPTPHHTSPSSRRRPGSGDNSRRQSLCTRSIHIPPIPPLLRQRNQGLLPQYLLQGRGHAGRHALQAAADVDAIPRLHPFAQHAGGLAQPVLTYTRRT